MSRDGRHLFRRRLVHLTDHTPSSALDAPSSSDCRVRRLWATACVQLCDKAGAGVDVEEPTAWGTNRAGCTVIVENVDFRIKCLKTCFILQQKQQKYNTNVFEICCNSQFETSSEGATADLSGAIYTPCPEKWNHSIFASNFCKC